MSLAAVMNHYNELRERMNTDTRFHVDLPDEKNSGYYQWWVVLKGPVGSLYEGGEYNLRLWFPLYYPYKPPAAGIVSPCYHPNINRTSYGVKLDHIRSQWHPKYTGIDIIEGVLKALADPDPDRQFANDGKHLNPEIARQFKEDREGFDKSAREIAKKAFPYNGNTHFWWEKEDPPKKKKQEKEIPPKEKEQEKVPLTKEEEEEKELTPIEKEQEKELPTKEEEQEKELTPIEK